MKIGQGKLSRRQAARGRGGRQRGAPVLHQAIPHQGLHTAVDDAVRPVGRARRRSRHPGRPAVVHPAHSGAVGRVDPRANGFDPQAILRDFDEGRVVNGVREWELVAEEKTIEVAPGVKYDAWAYNGRVPGPTLRAREGERLRIRFMNGGRHPHTIHFHGIHTARMDGVPGVGAGDIEPGRVDHLRVPRHALRPPSLPLPLDSARRAHREGALRRVHHRPEAGAPGGRRARDGHERVRHQLRPLERGLRGEHRRVRLPAPAGAS